MNYDSYYGSVLNYFKTSDFMGVDKKHLYSLIALDLTSIPFEKNSTKDDVSINDLDINYLDLTSPSESSQIQYQSYYIKEYRYHLYDSIVISTLNKHYQEYEERFFSLTSEYYNPYLLEKKIAGFLELWIHVCYRLKDYEKFYVFERAMNLILINKICSESLALILIEIICFGEIIIPREFFQNYPLEIEFISTNVQRTDSVNQQKIQKLLSIHEAFRDGSLEVLTCFIKMGLEYEFENVLEKDYFTFWYPVFLMRKDDLLRIKPEAMSLRRFLLLVHIFTTAKFSYEYPYAGFYEQFEEKLQILYMALPEPLITKKEVEKAFEETFMTFPYIKEGILKKLDTITQKSSSEPRRLDHLARCTIRKALNCNRMLPGGINKLRLPKSIKHYLMLKS